MSSKIVAAVPNSLLTQKSRSGSRSKSTKATAVIHHHNHTEQMNHSKSLASNRAIQGGRTGNHQVGSGRDTASA